MRIFCIPGLRLVVRSMYITKSVWLFESRTGGNFAGEKMTKTMHFCFCKDFFLTMLFLEQDFLLAF